MAAETPRQRLTRVQAWFRTIALQLQNDGSKHLGRIQTYSNDDTARDFTEKFKALQQGIQVVGAAVSKALNDPKTSNEVMTGLADEYTKLGNVVRDFNRSAWWESPSKAYTTIAIPFQVVGHVLVRVSDLVVAGGSSLYTGLTFGMKNLTTLLLLGGFLYFGVPWILKMRKAAKS